MAAAAQIWMSWTEFESLPGKKSLELAADNI